MLNIDKLHCTACGACVQKCPKQCISFVKTELGHLIPHIDTANCINCGLCEKVCPIDEEQFTREKQKVYAAVNKNEEVLKASTSGGFFTALAEYVLERSGVVYGCSFEDSFQASHIRVQQKEYLSKLRGSKYLQSNTNNTFKEAQQDLQAGRLVLYTGTPCQIAGLKSFLGKPFENLLTVDIVCHGVGSQAYFDRYMEYLTAKKGPIKDLHFRDKEFAGWSCGGVVILDGGKSNRKDTHLSYYDYNNYYYYYFLNSDIYRDSCYTCKYANTNRLGDFTMGDFWGVERYNLSLDTQNGCSLVIANTLKAQEIMREMTGALDMAEVTMDQATKANAQLIHPSEQSAVRQELAQQFEKLDAQGINRAFKKKNRKRIIKLHLKALIPYQIKAVIRKYR